MKNKRTFTAGLAGILTASALLAGMVIPASAVAVAEVDPSTYVRVAQPVTNIIGDVAIVRDISSKEEMLTMTAFSTTPATAIYTLDGQLQALDEDGKPFATVEEIFRAHSQRILAAFRIDNRSEAEALVGYLDYRRFYDCMIITDDPEVMKFARTAAPTTFGVIDYTETYKNETSLSTEQCLDIRRSMKMNNGTIALLPAHLCDRDTIQYLFTHQVNVWTQISDQPTETEQYHALLSGVVGVISDATDSLLDIACNKLPELTLTRSPLNVGHRGIPSKAPECTVEGSLLAFEQSANVVEMDVFLTTDGRVAAMHDITTEDTCNKNVNMEECTLAELKELYVNKGWENHPTYSQLRIPTLDEYLDAFKGKDCMLFIEIKSHKREIVSIIKKLVDERDMYDQCAVITFNEDTMKYMREDWPEMSVGALTNDFMQGRNPAEAAVRVGMEFAGPYNGTMNPEYDVYNGEGVRALMIRGISVYPWTFYESLDEYKNHFLWGSAGLTGNDAHRLKRLTKDVFYDLESSELECGDTISLQMGVTLYQRLSVERNPSVVTILEGEDLVQVNGEEMTVVGEEGRVTFVLGYTNLALDYTVHTQPITFDIVSHEETTLPETQAPVTDQATSTEADAPTGGCKATVSSAALVIVAATAAWISRKKKDD